MLSVREPVRWCKDHLQSKTWLCEGHLFAFLHESDAVEFALIYGGVHG